MCAYILWPPYDSPYNAFFDDKGRKQQLLDKIEETNARLKFLEQKNLESEEAILINAFGMLYGIVEIIPGINEEIQHPEGDCTAVVSLDGFDTLEIQIQETFLDSYLETLRKFFRAKLINYEDEFQNEREKLKDAINSDQNWVQQQFDTYMSLPDRETAIKLLVECIKMATKYSHLEGSNDVWQGKWFIRAQQLQTKLDDYYYDLENEEK